MRTCCFVGHRDPPEWVRAALTDAVVYHTEQLGVTDFLVGDYGGFDRMARAVLAELRRTRPEVGLHLMLAYLPAPGKAVDLTGCSDAIFPEGQELTPRRAAIPHLNRLMVEASDCMIAYVSHISGGAYKTLEYARKREKRGLLRIVNLAEQPKL